MLDTAFPRPPGDVGSPESYREEVEILRVPATVGQIVRSDPEFIDVEPFETALAQCRGDVIVTSCGFLAPWQAHLQRLSGRPFLASVLSAPPVRDALVVTFDAGALGPAHLAGWRARVVGLPRHGHLRAVIGADRPALDARRARAEVLETVGAALDGERALVLECTNLPPHAPALRRRFGLPVHHVLTALERIRPGLVKAPFLTAG
ncbi:hypothetical protein [Jannaschia sp. W003]|uniref:hypothetical protein n=1 Tax=Jannaschia sp. W003 TaxID=2867012 RepID=UPI0021A774BB|nr:hypothetical protein [Jannaschia sp. W003]UWQ22006.1 hypothetical protein K3554_02945 [Jannaschia sp. W003]